MIQLRTDCLVFRMPAGDSIPCAAAELAFEFVGDTAVDFDPDILRNAAVAVLHYFREELGQQTVAVADFAQALAEVLRQFGFPVETANTPDPVPSRVVDADLRQLACESGKGFELAFFPRLRTELETHLRGSPRLLRFTGLRSCVKQLSGARRWSGRCQELNDRIVDYLRACLAAAAPAGDCALVVM